MPRAKLQAPTRENLSDQAFLAIRNKILHGQFMLGSVLSRRHLAAELGMSMLPICAAIQRLENEGLVESKPRVGTRVRIPTEQEIRERYIVREALECQAARLVAERASLQLRQELVLMANQLDALYRRASVDGDTEFLFAVHGYHMQLHLRIAEYSGIATLRELIEKNSVLVLNWVFDLAPHQAPLPPTFHSDLIAAVTGTDMAAAERAMRDHIQFREEEDILAAALASTDPTNHWRLCGPREGRAFAPP
jgi:DNA-binding GntR family transcriptional regulator